MAPSVNLGKVNFYEAYKWGGDPSPFKIGDDITFQWPEDLNDKFKSCVVAADAKVLAWQHTNGTGIYSELEGAVESLAFIEGLSRFKVIQGTTGVIAFRFVDKTGGGPRKYSLMLNVREVGAVTMLSNDGSDDFKLVGTLPKDGPPVTTAVYVRNMETGVYLANGSIFFQWKNGQVEIVEDDNFPKQLKAKRDSANKFIMELISDKAEY